MSVRTLSVRAKSALTCLAPAAVFLAASSTALAHPGHSVEVIPAASPLHIVLQPEHAAGLLVVLAVGYLGMRAIVRHRIAKALRPVRVHND